MLDELKQQVFDANLSLVRYGLVVFTWGNVSGIHREKGLIVIKPSGVEYDQLAPNDMVIVDPNSGKTVDSNLKSSTDTVTYLELYKSFLNIGWVSFTHTAHGPPFLLKMDAEYRHLAQCMLTIFTARYPARED